MDFKVNDEASESAARSRNNKIILIISLVIALICGIGVFLIFNALLTPKETPPTPIEEQTLSTSDQTVQILYKYVTYGTRNKRNDKFVKENTVTLESFNNQERFYYALQFAKKSDFTATGRKNNKKEAIYNISEAKIREYMQRFFGERVSYSSKVSFNYPFNFKVNNKNVGFITSSETDGYDVVFNAVEGNIPSDLVEPYYTQLVAAYKETDGTYRLEEKVIYTRLEKNNNTYNVYLYRDYNQTKLIETLTNETDATLKKNPLRIDNYLSKAATITYHFGLYNNMLYFESSKISTE
jgi:hypothetical protein